MTGEILFGRRAKLTVGSLFVVSEGEDNLKIAFSVHKSVRLTENTAKIQIFNLAPTTRDRLTNEDSSLPGVVRHVVLEAGYGGVVQQLFAGDKAWVSHALRGPDWITSVESLDGNQLLTQQFPPKTFEAGASAFDVLGTLADVVKANWDNIKKSNDVVGELKRVVYDSGKTIDGSVRKAIDDIARDAHLEVSVQDGELNMWLPGVANLDTGVLLSESTGLVGVPELARNPNLKKKKTGQHRDSKTQPIVGADAVLVKGRCLLQGKIMPGRKFRLKSNRIGGGFGGDTLLRCLEVDHVGDSHGGDESWLTSWLAEVLAG